MPNAVLGLVLALAAVASPSGFDSRFTGRTLRFDYFHGGTAKEEHVSLDGLRLEGDWPGSRVHLLDDTNLGKYLFEVIDPATNQAIWSRGFSSIYGEWETTGEASAGTWRTFQESMRFPEPRGKVQLVLKKRGADGAFREIFSTVVDPASRFVDRSPVSAAGKVWTVFESGPPAVKVDLLVLGDGYTAARDGEVPRRRPPADRRPVRDRALQEPPERLQRAGDRPPVRRLRRHRSAHRHLAQDPARPRLQRLRFRALHADLRRRGDPRGRGRRRPTTR